MSAERAAIIKVGGFTPEGDPIGWQFNVNGDPSLMRHTVVAGRLVELGGWSVEELRSIWRDAVDMHRAQQ